MPSPKRKEKQKQKLLQKASQNCLSTNEPSTNFHSLTHALDLQMIYRFHQKLSNLKKHPTTITMMTYQMKIIESAQKIQNITMVLLMESQRKISLNI